MRKKAILQLESFIKILLVVIVLVILAVGVGKLYGATHKNQERENAQKFADILKTRIEAVQTNANLTLQGFQAENSWLVVGWSKNEPTRPDSCFFNSCVCVCPVGASVVDKEELKKSCQEGYCRKFNQEEIKVETYDAELIVVGDAVGGEGVQGFYRERFFPWIKIQSKGKLMSLSVKKTENSITFRYLSDDYLANKDKLQ